jgi:hypothetical protein
MERGRGEGVIGTNQVLPDELKEKYAYAGAARIQG